MQSERKNSALTPIILFLVAVIAIIVGLVLAGKVRDKNIKNPGRYANQDKVPRLTGIEAKDILENGEAVLVDTRDTYQYEAMHIKGAINIPVVDIEARLTELDPDIWYLTYCT